MGIPWESAVTGLTLVSPSLWQRRLRTDDLFLLSGLERPISPTLDVQDLHKSGAGWTWGSTALKRCQDPLVLIGRCQKSTKVPVTPKRQWKGMSQGLDHRSKLIYHISLPSPLPSPVAPGRSIRLGVGVGVGLNCKKAVLGCTLGEQCSLWGLSLVQSINPGGGFGCHVAQIPWASHVAQGFAKIKPLHVTVGWLVPFTDSRGLQPRTGVQPRGQRC